MAIWGWLAAGLVAVVLAYAAVAKLTRLQATADSFAALGLPAPRVFVVRLAAFELITAVLVLAVPRLGAILAALLLGAFTVFLVARLVRGRGGVCACFGSPDTRITWWGVARNAALLGAAAVVLVATA